MRASCFLKFSTRVIYSVFVVFPVICLSAINTAIMTNLNSKIQIPPILQAYWPCLVLVKMQSLRFACLEIPVQNLSHVHYCIIYFLIKHHKVICDSQQQDICLGLCLQITCNIVFRNLGLYIVIVGL